MPKPNPKHMSNVHVELSGGSAALCCDYGGDRYHVWCSRDGTIESEMLFKNPALDVARDDPAHYWTRKLSLTSAFGAGLVAAMLAEAKAGGLFEAAIEAEKVKRATAKNAAALRAIEDVKCEFGPAMFAALVSIAGYKGKPNAATMVGIALEVLAPVYEKIAAITKGG